MAEVVPPLLIEEVPEPTEEDVEEEPKAPFSFGTYGVNFGDNQRDHGRRDIWKVRQESSISSSIREISLTSCCNSKNILYNRSSSIPSGRATDG